MANLDLAQLRLRIDLEGLYVDFSILRSELAVPTIADDAGVRLSAANKDGERRGKCPKCGKENGLAVNIDTNRFNCFAKGCTFKGGGVIDFFAKLNGVPAKEASHLLACAYGIEPYGADSTVNEDCPAEVTREREADKALRTVGEYVTRKEFEDLKARFNRLSNFVWTYMLENDPSTGKSAKNDQSSAPDRVLQ